MNMLSCSLGLLKRYLALLSYKSQVTWTNMSFLFAMPRPVAHGPTLKCANYLLCTSGRYLHRATGTRSAYCLSCGSSAMCKYTGCANHALPKVLAPSDSFIDHALLQSCAQETLPWPHCANAISRGCQKPSKTDGGGFCFACEASNLPCLNASRGCRRHVHSNPNGTLGRGATHGAAADHALIRKRRVCVAADDPRQVATGATVPLVVRCVASGV